MQFYDNQSCEGAPDQCLLFKSNRPKQGGSFLSNFWPNSISKNAMNATLAEFPHIQASEGSFIVQGIAFHSVEQYFQWRKFDFINSEYKAEILSAVDAADAKKKAGKGVYTKWAVALAKDSSQRLTLVEAGKNFQKGLVEFWKVSKDIMFHEAIPAKFDPKQNPSLCLALVETYPRFLAEQHGRSASPWDIVGVEGIGRNWLGEALMLRRRKLFKHFN
jgi:predicted NAD-dependent protein-ADP-ribosyltransferase YbiA (DUF1768 family)